MAVRNRLDRAAEREESARGRVFSAAENEPIAFSKSAEPP